jgi:hypothetical protein
MSLFVIIVCILAYQVNLETTVNEEQTKKIETTTTTAKVPILCSKERYNDSSLLVDSIKVTQGCINGEKTVTYTIVLDGGIEINRSAIGTKQPLAPKCDSNYSGCVPIVSYDLDCADIGYTVSVLGNDKHRLDGDRDGYGCESY